MRIGAHVRTAQGLVAAVDYARDVGCETIQVFAKSPLQWSGPARPREEIAPFRRALADAGITLAATHAAYLINLSSDDSQLWRRSVAALAEEIVLAHRLGAPAVVVHLGSSPRPPEAARSRVAAAVTEALQATAGVPVAVLLENAAGAGHTFGWRFEDIAAVCAGIEPSLRPRVGTCIDTCHAYAAGYDLRSPRGWDALLRPLVTCGASVRLVHANDALGALGSRRDRHAWIGDGAIGLEGFAHLFARPELESADVVIEMPGEPPQKDAVNVTRLKALRSSQGGSLQDWLRPRP